MSANYGPGIVVIDRLAYSYVQRLNGRNFAMSQRFRAPISGTMASVQIYLPVGSSSAGYASGTGGQIRIGVYPDDNSSAHRPNMSENPIAFATFRPSMASGTFSGAARMFPIIPVNSSDSLKAGSLYHVVYEQTDPDPSTNFANINSTATNMGSGRPARWLSPTDWGVLYGERASALQAYSWGDATAQPYGGLYYVPILQVRTTSGESFGSTVMESGNDRNREWAVGSGNPIRERYTASQNRTISGLSIMTSSTAGGSLKWEIKRGDSVLANGTINDSGSGSFATVKSLSYDQGVYSWYDVTLPTSIQFQQGATYDVVFTPQGGSEWHFAAQSNGGQWGFTNPAAFTESQAQAYTNGQWLNANIWNKNATTYDRTNWRVVLH